jgi:cbb3-type cytochrome c oxidase subunit III
MNNQVKDPLLLDHEYDGIHELDNKLPTWWVWLFWGCNVFGVAYLLYYHVFAQGDLKALGQMKAEYTAEMKIGDAIKQRTLAAFEGKIDGEEPSKDPVVIARGQATFELKCAPCHRKDAGGLVGPNLCDDYWIHGSKGNARVEEAGHEALGDPGGCQLHIHPARQQPGQSQAARRPGSQEHRPVRIRVMRAAIGKHST